MIIKNNLKNLNFLSNLKIKYAIDDFLSLDMFNPINQKNYFNSYNLGIFKNRTFRTHVLGMGGSSLSSKLLGQFMDPSSIDKKLFFYDNPSPTRIRNSLSDLKIGKKDKFIFISKSGNTIETKYFLHLVIKILKQKKISNFYKSFIFITEDKNNYMKNFAKKNNILCFDHDPNIGGRFSIFSITALLPLISIGYPLDNILKSLKKAKKIFFKNHIKFSKSIFDSIAYEKKNVLNIIVGLSYHDKINVINEWYRQIFAESLGKNKNAKNYISSYGSIDQHSQFQLYIDGPYDKNFIFFKIDNKKKYIRSKSSLIKDHNLMSVLEDGAIKTLEQKKFMVTQISIKNNFDNYCLLLYFLIFDIYLRSINEKINFLDQPAVEILKRNTKA